MNSRSMTSFLAFSFEWAVFISFIVCLQARAFGRRLPWTALVPFADLLVRC
jgi:hypothetical protein